jgi:hypothetical protein
LLLLETVVVAKLVADDAVADDIAVADVVAAGVSPSSLELEVAAVEVWSSGLPLRLAEAETEIEAVRRALTATVADVATDYLKPSLLLHAASAGADGCVCG